MFVKAFHLFVSSTFADFDQERGLLQGRVFPALDSYCAAKGYQFHPLDMRWGVNTEAQLDQRAAEICLGEVDDVKGYPPPNFLILIGNRHGWVPLPYAIACDEFEALFQWLDRHGEQDAARALRTVYQLDENYLGSPSGTVADGHAPVSAYTLRSRAELKEAGRWDEQEAQLRCALQMAADALSMHGQIVAAEREKYFASLTEQEIVHRLFRHTDGRTT
jgi:hypothetical protein